MEFLKEFVAEEQDNFEKFDEYIGETILEGITDAIAYYLSRGLEKGDEAQLTLPHGIYKATFKSKGDIENINVSFAESSDFVKCVNGDIDNVPTMEDIDSKFIEYVINCVGTGVADPVKFSDKINTVRVGVELSRMEATFFLNEIAKKLAKLAKEFEKPGKIISFEINKHGAFEFSYGDNKTGVRFIPDLIFKQAVKNDLHTGDVGAAKFTARNFRNGKKAKKGNNIQLSAK